MKRQQNDLILESFSFVTQKPDITSDLLPDYLLENWSIKDETDVDYPYQAFLTIYTAYQFHKTGSNVVQVDTEQFNSLFSQFQHLLAMESLQRKLPFDFAPQRIFDFDSYKDEVEVSIRQGDIPLFMDMYNQPLSLP